MISGVLYRLTEASHCSQSSGTHLRLDSIGLEHFPFLCTARDACLAPSHNAYSRGLKPAARHTLSGNALISVDRALRISGLNGAFAGRGGEFLGRAINADRRQQRFEAMTVKVLRQRSPLARPGDRDQFVRVA